MFDFLKKNKNIKFLKKNLYIKYNNLISHIAIIMDGNGRWAEKRGKLRIFGHKAGVKAVYSTIKFAIKLKLKALTLYAFSSENWSRPLKEVLSLIKLFNKTIKTKVNKLNNNNIRLNFIGNIKKLSIELQENIYKSEEITKNNTGLLLNIAINYGGRWDITETLKKLLNEIKNGLLSINDINESIINQNISINESPPVDLIIRTGGEKRISNFLLWQMAYSELYFTDVLWPDFNEIEFFNALKIFSKRNRRFGNINN